MKKKYTRVTAFFVIISLIFAILITRLVYIQIVNGDSYKNSAEAKGEKQILELAPRGEILDRNKQKLATNLQSFNVTYSNTDTKLNNNVKNTELIESIKIIEKNGDASKLNTQMLPISVDNNKYMFTFSAKTGKFRVILANNFVKNNNLGLPELSYVSDNKVNEANLSKFAKDVFCVLAHKFGLTQSDMDNMGKKTSTKKTLVIDYNLRKDISMDVMQKLIALRLSIINTGFSQYKTVYIANNVKKETFMAMLYKSNELHSITCEVAPMRYYPNGEIGSAFLGYLSKIDESQSEKYANLGYDVSRELIGKTGLEKVLENNNDLNIRLKGESGYTFVDVDKLGRVLKQTATLDPIPGDTVVTTIDLNLQKVAEDALNKTMSDISSGRTKLSGGPYTNANRGAAVVVNVNTGEVLALASRPGFDPNWFAATGSISEAIAAKIFPQVPSDTSDKIPKPMFNYATMGSGPPGSILKPFVSIAALQEKVITPATIIVDKGIYRLVKGFRGACWKWNEYHSTHGPVNLAKALAVSCNYFFFDVGRRLGYPKFEDWAAKFGLASNPQTGEAPSTGIEIGEIPGDVSSPYRYKATNINFIMTDQVINYLKDYNHGGNDIIKGNEDYNLIKSMFMDGKYDEKKLQSIGIVNTKALKHLKMQINQFDNEANSEGQLLNAAIGQGSTLLNPLQLVNYMATLVNGGNRYKLHLVKKVLDPNGTVKKEIQPELINKIDISPENVNAVKAGMEKVTEEGGTASTAFNGMHFLTGGKTGSASVSEGQKKLGRSAYGWYLGFAPLDKPKIAVIVVIYDAGAGGAVAPVARKIYDQYFGLNKPKVVPTTTVSAINPNVH